VGIDDNLRRVPPQSLEAEESVLGGVLLDNGALDRVVELLRSEDFYRSTHRKIFRAMLQLAERSEPVDLITLSETLKASGDLPDVGGTSYLAELAERVPTAANVVHYARIVRDRSLLRNLIGAATDIASKGYDADGDVAELLDQAERSIFNITERQIRASFSSIGEVLVGSLKTIERLYEQKQAVTGVPTGFADLDRITAGLQPSDLIIVAGRPGMGKTALATNIAYNVARAWRGEVRADGHIDTVNGGIAGFFSLEMSAEQLATRIIAEQSGIPSSTIRRGGINERDFEKIKDVAIELQHLPFFIDETGGLTVAQLAARARRLKRQKGLDLLVIDYIQLLQGSSRRAMEGRVQEVTEITTSLKALAKELNVPILALSQLSRQVENRDDKRPQLSDLRESGSIEQDADVVLFVFREEYYLSNKEPRPGTDEHTKWQVEMASVHGKAEIIIGKQRHGPTGTVNVQFDAAVTRFDNLARDDQMPERV